MAMEATGVYWNAVHWVLEELVPEVWVINARHMCSVPGRKTNVADAQWGASLLEHGLVRPRSASRLRERGPQWDLEWRNLATSTDQLVSDGRFQPIARPLRAGAARLA